MDFGLCKGLHPIEIQYFQAGGGEGLKLEWKTKGIAHKGIDGQHQRHQQIEPSLPSFRL